MQHVQPAKYYELLIAGKTDAEAVAARQERRRHPLQFQFVRPGEEARQAPGAQGRRSAVPKARLAARASALHSSSQQAPAPDQDDVVLNADLESGEAGDSDATSEADAETPPEQVELSDPPEPLEAPDGPKISQPQVPESQPFLAKGLLRVMCLVSRPFTISCVLVYQASSALHDSGSRGLPPSSQSSTSSDGSGSTTTSSSHDGSSSSSSSSTSSDNEAFARASGSAASVPVQGAVAAVVPVAKRQVHKRRNDVAEMWGDWFRLTPTRQGMQITCLIPGHQTSSSCTKSRNFHLPSEAVVMVMLKRWGQLGADVETKAGHKELWQLVVEEEALQELPTEASLDAWALDFRPDED